jgi:AcrR family transcriptional regulator
VARVAGRSYSREDVAQAAWRVIVRDGLHRTSVRAIARELDATTGVVTYYFKNKTELLHFAMDRLTNAIGREIEAAVEGATGVERIRRTFGVTLPLGPRQITGWRIWVAFLGLAQSSRRLREEHQRRLQILSDRVAADLEQLQADGLLAAEVDPRVEADALIAVADGIGLGYLLRPKLFPPERQLEILNGYLATRLADPRPAAG